MQRRAAAIYFAFFVIVAAGAYGLLVSAQAPHVTFDAEAHAVDDTVTLSDRTYTVTEIKETGGGGGGHGGGGGGTVEATMAWTNESAQLSATLDNGTTVPPTELSWEGQAGRSETTVQDGDTVPVDGESYSVSVNGTAGTVTITNTANASMNETLEVGDTFQYRGEETTVTAVSGSSATLVWGTPYRVDVPNVSAPSNATLVQERNVTKLLVEDPALYNETVTIDGVRYVTYKANDTNVRFLEYFGEPDRHRIEVGDTLRYEGNETTVDSIERSGVTLVWSGSKTNTVTVPEGGNVTVGQNIYFAHFPDNKSVQVLSYDERIEDYRAQKERIDAYEERKRGLWGIVELSGIAAVILLGAAYLPVKNT